MVAREATTEHHTKSKTWAFRDMIPSYFTDKPTWRTRRDVLQLGCLKADRHFRRNTAEWCVCSSAYGRRHSRTESAGPAPTRFAPNTPARSRDLGLRDSDLSTGPPAAQPKIAVLSNSTGSNELKHKLNCDFSVSIAMPKRSPRRSCSKSDQLMLVCFARQNTWADRVREKAPHEPV